MARPPLALWAPVVEHGDGPAARRPPDAPAADDVAWLVVDAPEDDADALRELAAARARSARRGIAVLTRVPLRGTARGVALAGRLRLDGILVDAGPDADAAAWALEVGRRSGGGAVWIRVVGPPPDRRLAGADAVVWRPPATADAAGMLADVARVLGRRVVLDRVASRAGPAPAPLLPVGAARTVRGVLVRPAPTAPAARPLHPAA